MQPVGLTDCPHSFLAAVVPRICSFEDRAAKDSGSPYKVDTMLREIRSRLGLIPFKVDLIAHGR